MERKDLRTDPGKPDDVGAEPHSSHDGREEPVDPALEAGDAACWAHLLCPDCGAVLDGGPHAPGCRSGVPS